ncbi:Phenylalanyl-tRNA synthetase, beta subunit, cytoplasmic [Cytospora paraplurivora]|uniref:phenylalanine--tRNA ligase n=1 Tax=Cytospora paraplurivora TaxID=2898453 RepID=A0AAN9YDS1_9PEZI
MEIRTKNPIPSGQDGADGDVAVQILKTLDQTPNEPLLSAKAFPASTFTELKAALDKLASREMVRFDTIEKEVVALEEEAEGIVANGSHEVRVFKALQAAGEAGLTVQELEQAIGDKNITKVGQGRAFKDKWIAKTADGKLKAVRESVQDVTKEQLQTVKDTGAFPDKKVLADLKKRKLVKTHKIFSFEIYKAAKFALSIPEEATDLTADMLTNGSWKTATFKPYNFKALGAKTQGGALHPLNKVRTEVRQIFFETGFEEMPTDKLFYISDPKVADRPRATSADDKEDYEAYWENVRAVHQEGKYGSVGYRYPWAADEALRLVLRTHTTAVSARMLHKLAAKKGPDGRPPPARYFSIDRVFRNESVDATHLAEFHQFIELFFAKMGLTGLRFKPAYNPYTEPSMEIFAFHEGLNKLIEVGNSGMFRPEMLEAMGFPKDMRVYGWGLSLERPTMIKYGISNIRELLGHKLDLNFVQNAPAVRLDVD